VTRIAYLDCVGGLAGDMLVAALLDAGGPVDILEQLPAQLGIEPVAVTVTRVERQGVGAPTSFTAAHGDAAAIRTRPRRRRPRRQPPARARPPPRLALDPHPARGAALTGTVRARSLATFSRLRRAEAVHGVPIDDVHFHELGAVDTPGHCGAIALVDALGIETIACSPPRWPGQHRGGSRNAPLPAPATRCSRG
jgi:uncharacterized protein (DUF111 family)